VPHLKVEEAIAKVLGDAPCVVTGIPDDARGERLAVLYVHPTLTPEDLFHQISETDMPRLWIPKRENLYLVEALPQLGTGKLDLRGVRNLAQELVGQASRPVPCSTPQIYL
jgi:acyl-[acyl-carrier-protein]-phospholipid O-acyltransferase/long-chain-fatty-acid--[acyl-carrier-protein] ligase